MPTTNKIRHKRGKNNISKPQISPTLQIIPEFHCQLLLRQDSSADWPDTIYNGHLCWCSQGSLNTRILFDTGPHYSRISATGPHKVLQVLVFGKEHTGPQNNLQGARNSEQPVM